MKRVWNLRLSIVPVVILLLLASLRAGARDYESQEDYEWLKSCDVDCILISLSEQRMDVFGDHQLIGWSTISSGRTGHDTPTGLYFVSDKEELHHSNLYHNAPMPFFMRLTDSGVGMHAGVLPGYPASHGCIRLPPEMARLLFNHVNPGTFVQIIPGPIDSVFTTTQKAASGAVANN